MKFIAILLLAIQSIANTRSPLQFKTSYLNCWDGETELSFEVGGDNSPAELGNSFSFKELFNQANTMRIRKDGKVYTYTTNTVIASDGAGNEAVQTLVQDSFGPIRAVTEFTFEHEGAYLDGYYSLPKDGVDLSGKILSKYDFQAPIEFKGMFCNFGLLDQFGIPYEG